MFRVNPKTVTRWARSGKISAIRTLGGHRRFRKSEITRILTEGGDTAGMTWRRRAGWPGPASIRRPRAFQARALPTELPCRVDAAASSAVLTGFEPAASALTGRRALQTAPQDLEDGACRCPVPPGEFDSPLPP